MKKFVSLLLALVMAFSLVACGGSETPVEDQSSASQIVYGVTNRPATLVLASGPASAAISLFTALSMLMPPPAMTRMASGYGMKRW